MPAEFLCINEPFVGKCWEDKHVLDRPLKKKNMKHETECVEKADYITKGLNHNEYGNSAKFHKCQIDSLFLPSQNSCEH